MNAITQPINIKGEVLLLVHLFSVFIFEASESESSNPMFPPTMCHFVSHVGSVWAALGSMLMYFHASGARPWTSFSMSGKSLKIIQKTKEKGNWNGHNFMEFKVFPENAEVRFDCAGANGLRFRPLVFWVCVSIFALLFLHRFFKGFWSFQGTLNSRVGAGGGTPFNEWG